MDLRVPTTPAASPEHDQIAYVLSGGEQPPVLRVASADGHVLAEFSGAHAPQWVGRDLWFLLPVAGVAQVVRWRDGAQAVVTAAGVDVLCFRAQGDEVLVAVVCDSNVRDIAAAQPVAAARTRVFEGGYVRRWDRWTSMERIAIWRQRVGGSADRVTPPDFDDTPSRPFPSSDTFDFAPDGGVLFVSQPVQGARWRTARTLWWAPVSGGCVALLEREALITSVRTVQGGNAIAIGVTDRPGHDSDLVRLEWSPWRPGAMTWTPWTSDWDRGVLSWAPSTEGAWLTADDSGQRRAFFLPWRASLPRPVPGASSVTQLSAGRGGALSVVSGLGHPPHLAWLTEGGRRSLGPVTTVGATPAVRVVAAGWRGEPVSAWLIAPDDGAPRPLIVAVHGGPQTSYGDIWTTGLNAQVLVSRGFAVLVPDVHGSSGYGRAHMDAIRGDWGSAPTADLDALLDLLKATTPHVDVDRVGLLGSSWGGWLSCHLQAARPDRFRCLVMAEGALSPRLLWMDSDEFFFSEWEMGGRPWDVPEAYAAADPSLQAATWRTPMLILHGRRDFRVTEVHALGAFGILQRQGVPSRLVLFEEAAHQLGDRRDVAVWWAEVLGWMDRWLTPTSSP